MPRQRRLRALCPYRDGPVEEGGKLNTIAFVVNKEELVVTDRRPVEASHHGGTMPNLFVD
jgi:hypothetical protein